MNDQRSLMEQLFDLVAVANREGLYDAADWIQRQLEYAIASAGRPERNKDQ